MPVPQVTYPASVYGYTNAQPNGEIGVVEYAVASTTVTAGDTVILDTANLGQIKSAATNSATNLVVGIAYENIAASAIGGVVIAGRAVARVSTTVTAGDRLALDSTNAARLASITAGVAVTTVAALGTVVATAEETQSTVPGTVHVRIVKF